MTTTRRGGDRRHQVERRVGEKIQTPPDWPHGGLGGLPADGDEGPCDLSSERIRAEGNPNRQGSEWVRRRYLKASEGLLEALDRVTCEAGHYANSPEDETRIAVETVATALSWWRDRTFETWKPVRLFLGTPKDEKLIGVGWRGRLLIWKDPLRDTYEARGADYYKTVTEEHLRHPPANLADRQRLCVVVSHPARAQCEAVPPQVWHRVQDCHTEILDGLELAVAVWLVDP